MPVSAARARFREASPSYAGVVQSLSGGSPASPDSWESIRRMVTVSIGPKGLSASFNSGRCATAGSSRCSSPSSRSCRIAVPVNVLVIEATR